MIFSFKAAFRFLISGKGQTLLIAFGIAIGVSVQIFIGLLIQGLQDSLIQKTIGSSPHITLKASEEGEGLTDYRDIMAQAKGTDADITHISAAVDGSAFIKFDDTTQPVLLRGLDLPDADPIYAITDKTYEGQPVTGQNEVIAGKDLREKLDLKLGDEVELITPAADVFKLKIVGFYDFKVASVNKSWLITGIPTAQEVFGYENEATSIEIQVNEVFKADALAEGLAGKLNNPQILIENWKAQNEDLLSGLNGQSISSIMIQVFVLVSVILGIASVLAISVLQKSKQIGILKAMGLNDRKASLVFLFQGLMLGIAGALLGIGLGIGLIVSFTTFALNTDGTPVVPVVLDWGFIAVSGIIAVLSASLASLIPARKSSRLSPIEVIRNG